MDYLSLRKHESEEARAAYEQYRQRRLQEDAKDPVPATFQYGSQKLHVSKPDIRPRALYLLRGMPPAG